ncbi:MAG: 50S ribosomal protein L7/L12 [Patescibacteria group bacterium]|jgi:large subunit ribosomal protein L7/L12|nr:50S ribosomal protein L7/L12 [Patescibacteria group bacterium]
MTEEIIEVPAKFKDLVETIEKMNLVELSELVKVLEKKFGVSSQAPVAVAAGAVAAADAGEEKEEQTTFNVEITDSGSNKISVIKAIREITSLGLKEAKDMVDAAPKVVKEGVGKEEAATMKKKLEEAGAKVTLK